MSLLPILLNYTDDPLEDTFGFGLYPEHFYHSRRCQPTNLCLHIYQRQWSVPQRNKRPGQPATNLTKSSVGKDGFQVCMDVLHFQPNEIIVKTVDNSVVIEGKHEEKEDEHGHIYRHFVRRYELPKEFDVKDVMSALSSDGVLTIKAPPKAQTIESNERVIQIQQTGPAHLSVKSNNKEKEAGEKMSE